MAGFRYLGNDAVINAVLKSMHAAKRIKLTDRGISLVGQGPKLSNNEQKLLVQLAEIFRAAELKPPTVKECQQQVTKNRELTPGRSKVDALSTGCGLTVNPPYENDGYVDKIS